MSKHIILIEDDPELSDAISLILTENGYTVSCFSAFTSQTELGAMNPDLFMLDERLPTVSGHIISIMLRSYPATKHVPQLLMSASPVLAKFAELGEADASLKKPFEMDELLRIVAFLILKN